MSACVWATAAPPPRGAQPKDRKRKSKKSKHGKKDKKGGKKHKKAEKTHVKRSKTAGGAEASPEAKSRKDGLVSAGSGGSRQRVEQGRETHVPEVQEGLRPKIPPGLATQSLEPDP